MIVPNFRKWKDCIIPVPVRELAELKASASEAWSVEKWYPVAGRCDRTIGRASAAAKQEEAGKPLDDIKAQLQPKNQGHAVAGLYFPVLTAGRQLCGSGLRKT